MAVAKVRLYATLRKYTPGVAVGQSIEIEMPEGSTLTDLVARLGIPSEAVRMGFVNNLQQDMSCVIRDGDAIAFFPPVAGG